jgi:hypothetical protein
MKMRVLIGAEQKKLVLGYLRSLAWVQEEAHTIPGLQTLEIPDLSVFGIPGRLRRERRYGTAAGGGYAECYRVEDTNLEASGDGVGQLPRVLLLTAARNSL